MPFPTVRWFRFPRINIKSLVAAFLGLVLLPIPARAVVTYGGTGQSIVTGSGAGSTQGYQYEGQWQNNFLGTAIAPNYFITATHLGGHVGDSFVYNGTSYTTTGAYTDPSSPDLTIWKVNGTFGQYAPIATAGNEVGQNMVVYGESGPRGSQITIGGTTYGGYYFTGSSTSVSYGTNVINYTGPISGGGSVQYLTFQFNAALGPLTASLAPGDSGGGVFILQNGVWSLAGVNYAVDGPYNIHAVSDPNYKSSDAFDAAVYNQSGLFYDGSSTPLSGPASSYASRISTEAGWIGSVTGLVVPEPSAWFLLMGGLTLAGPMVWKRLETN